MNIQKSALINGTLWIQLWTNHRVHHNKWTVWNVSYIPVKQLPRDNVGCEAKQALPADSAWPWNKPLRDAWLINEWMNQESEALMVCRGGDVLCLSFGVPENFGHTSMLYWPRVRPRFVSMAKSQLQGRLLKDREWWVGGGVFVITLTCTSDSAIHDLFQGICQEMMFRKSQNSLHATN